MPSNNLRSREPRSELRLFAVLAVAVLLSACSGSSDSPDVAHSTRPATTAEAPAEATDVPVPVSEGDTEVTAEAAIPPAKPTQQAPEIQFVISPDESEARFIVDEILAGNPKRVVGKTKLVSGSLEVALSDTSNLKVGPVEIDLSDLETDSGFRNRAIHNSILETGDDSFRFAKFTTTSVSGLPAVVEIGVSYEITLAGDLTIHGVTKEATFTGHAVASSENRIEASASVTILYEEFNVRILRLPDQVASVDDSVILEIDLVAVAR